MPRGSKRKRRDASRQIWPTKGATSRKKGRPCRRGNSPSVAPPGATREKFASVITTWALIAIESDYLHRCARHFGSGDLEVEHIRKENDVVFEGPEGLMLRTTTFYMTCFDAAGGGEYV